MNLARAHNNLISGRTFCLHYYAAKHQLLLRYVRITLP